MAFKIAEAFVDIKGDKGKFSKTIRGAKAETAGFAKSATKNINLISTAFKALATVVVARLVVAIGVKLVRAIINAGKAAITTAVKYDRLKIGLIAVTGSAAEAARQLRRLRVLALEPGLGFEQAIQGTIALQAAGIAADLAERSLSAFGNALAVAGRGAETLGRVNLQLSQIAAKTSGFGRDLLVIREAVPSIGPILARAFDNKPLEDIKISGKELIAVLVEGLEGLNRAGESVGNNLVNLGISFDLLKKAIGDKLLGATNDVVKSLTGITDKLAIVVENYEVFRDDVAKILRDISIIGIRTTTAMMESLGKIIKSASKVIFLPLKAGLKIALLEGLADVITGGIFEELIQEVIKTILPFELLAKVMDKTGGAFDRLTKPIDDLVKKRTVAIWAETTAKSAGQISESGLEIENTFNELFAALIGGFAEVDTRLGTFTANIEKLNQFEAGLRSIADSFLSMFRGKPEIPVPELPTLTEKQKEALFPNLFPEDPKKAVSQQKSAWQKIRDVRNAIFEEFDTKAQANLESFQQLTEGIRERTKTLAGVTQALWEAQQEQVRRVVDTIAPAFENMFSDFFAGDTKVTWENFFKDLKRIAIRQLAQVFATQLLTGLLTGGASFGAMGLGSALSALAPRSVDPTSRAVGGAVRRGAGTVGSFLEGGTINVYDQDLSNFDQQRMTKQVQAIVPALSQAAADGY